MVLKTNSNSKTNALPNREPVQLYSNGVKDLYGNTADLCKMVENNCVLSIKSTYPVSSCILCHLPALQTDSKRFRRVSVIRVSTVKCNGKAELYSALFQPYPKRETE